MKKYLKIIHIIIICIILINIFSIHSIAAITTDDYKAGDITDQPRTVAIGNTIVGAFQAIGSIVSVLALVLIGIKYMLGSVEEKAEYKDKMIYYIIGAILVFAISNISAALYRFGLKL